MIDWFHPNSYTHIAPMCIFFVMYDQAFIQSWNCYLKVYDKSKKLKAKIRLILFFVCTLC